MQSCGLPFVRPSCTRVSCWTSRVPISLLTNVAVNLKCLAPRDLYCVPSWSGCWAAHLTDSPCAVNSLRRPKCGDSARPFPELARVVHKHSVALQNSKVLNLSRYFGESGERW